MAIRFLLVFIALFILSLFQDFILQIVAKKSNYNCDTCGVWDCPNKQCRKHRV